MRVKVNNSKKRSFNCLGGEILSKIGLSFYICYLHYINFNQNDKRWQNLTNGSVKSRINKIEKNTNYADIWLNEGIKAKKVSSNKLGISVNEVNSYAQKLLNKGVNNLKFK